MQLPLQVVFHGVEHSDAVEARVRERAAKLERYFDHITACRVVVDAPHRHHKKGAHYNVRIDITVPGDELVVNRDPSEHDSHSDVYVAIRDAFDAADRILEDYARKRRGNVKHHAGRGRPAPPDGG